MESVMTVSVKLNSNEINDIMRSGELSTEASNRLIQHIISDVQKKNRPDSSVKSKKAKKPRGPTRFNIFTHVNKSKITDMLADKTERGAFSKKASEIWKAMTEEEKSEYEPPLVIVNSSSSFLPASKADLKEYLNKKASKGSKPKKSKKQKATKVVKNPRGPSPFNRFVKKNKDIIKKQLGEGKQERGVFIKKASELWKALDDTEKATYETST